MILCIKYAAGIVYVLALCKTKVITIIITTAHSTVGVSSINQIRFQVLKVNIKRIIFLFNLYSLMISHLDDDGTELYIRGKRNL